MQATSPLALGRPIWQVCSTSTGPHRHSLPTSPSLDTRMPPYLHPLLAALTTSPLATAPPHTPDSGKIGKPSRPSAPQIHDSGNRQLAPSHNLAFRQKRQLRQPPPCVRSCTRIPKSTAFALTHSFRNPDFPQQRQPHHFPHPQSLCPPQDSPRRSRREPALPPTSLRPRIQGRRRPTFVAAGA
jgi:hypothetical protein